MIHQSIGGSFEGNRSTVRISDMVLQTGDMPLLPEPGMVAIFAWVCSDGRLFAGNAPDHGNLFTLSKKAAPKSRRFSF